MSQQAWTPIHMKLSTKGIKGSKERTPNGQNRFCQVYTFKFIYFLIGGDSLALRTQESPSMPTSNHLVCRFPTP